MLVDLLARQGWGGDRTTGARQHDDAAPAPEAGAAPGTGRSECTCGGTTPSACRICPVCQLISFVKQVSPETIDRVAEIVDLAATALRDLAQAQRDQHGPPPETEAEPDAPSPDGRMGPS
jgi:hypothetical protein